MPIKFNCNACSAAIKAPETHAGQTLPCPKCGTAVTVPTVAQGASATAVDVPPAFPEPSDPEAPAELPEIVTNRVDVPPPAPVVQYPSSEEAPNAYSAPQTVARPTQSLDLSDIRIVDIDVPFWSVFKFAFRFFAANLLLVAVLYGVMFLLGMLIFTLIGVGSFAP